MASKSIRELRAALEDSLFNLALNAQGVSRAQTGTRHQRQRAEADAQSAAQFHVAQGYAAATQSDWGTSLPQVLHRVDWGKAQHKTAAECMSIGRCLAAHPQAKLGGEPERQ